MNEEVLKLAREIVEASIRDADRNGNGRIDLEESLPFGMRLAGAQPCEIEMKQRNITPEQFNAALKALLPEFKDRFAAPAEMYIGDALKQEVKNTVGLGLAVFGRALECRQKETAAEEAASMVGQPQTSGRAKLLPSSQRSIS